MNYFRASLMLLAASTLAMADDGWADLFNGKNLDGWVQRGGTACRLAAAVGW